MFLHPVFKNLYALNEGRIFSFFIFFSSFGNLYSLQEMTPVFLCLLLLHASS